MKIEISTEFEPSHTENYRTKITSRIVNERGVVLCVGEDHDVWLEDAKLRRATAKEATRIALEMFEFLLRNARDVANRSGLV